MKNFKFLYFIMQEIGCDRVLGSDLKEDDCGVCNGDGSKCRNISSKVTKRINRKINGILILKKNAMSI